MFSRISRVYRKTLAIAEKEIKLKLRFPLNFFSEIFIKPFISLIPYIILYAGIFTAQSPNNTLITLYLAKDYPDLFNFLLFNFLKDNFSSSFNQTTYLSWLLVGNIIFIFSRNGFDAFMSRFRTEKYWSTIQGMLLTPINRYLMLLGFVITSFIESMIFFVMMIIISFLVYPIAFYQVILIFLIAFLMILASSGLGLIKGAVYISTESLLTIFELLQFFILFISCYSIPIEYFPESLQFLALINPFYHGVNSAQNIYFGNYSPDLLFSIGYITIFAIVTTILGVYLFNRIWKKFGIHGY
ncbi:MAG: ABC transporter permease [Candidatus Helarchaeota archaeon]|nr:ABC transporter permease [Candidatus Helarchaeota archaeon]